MEPVEDSNADSNQSGWTARGRRFLSRQTGKLAHWIGPQWAALLILAFGATVVSFLTAASAEIYDAVSESEDIASLDQPALNTAIELRTPELNAAMTAFTNLGGQPIIPVLAAIATAVLVYLRRSIFPIILMVVATAGSTLMVNVGKEAIGRRRPPLEAAVPPFESSPAFPSGHTLNTTVIAGVVAYLLVLYLRRRRNQVIAVLLAGLFAVAMGMSRVYLGHHWLTDVAVAWTLGLAWLAVLITAHRLLLTLGSNSRRRPPSFLK